MRFISKSAKFALQIRRQIIESYATGQQRVTQEPIYCSFQTGLLSQEERDLAVRYFAFEGQMQELDEVTPLSPDYRLSLYDTDVAARDGDWDAELKAHVEAKLIDHCERFTDVMVVPVKVFAPPWPRYDEYAGTPAALIRKLGDEGYSITDVLAYERVNQNRAPIVDALERAAMEIEDAEMEIVG